MNIKYYQRIANQLTQNNLANDLIEFYKTESGIYEWNFDILNVVISLMYVKGYSLDTLISLIS